MKIGVIGCGYWGKIIINNLIQLGYENLVLCDTTAVVSNLNFGRRFETEVNYESIDCDKVFVLTPVSHHFKICKHFLEKGIDVFCEKVLTDDVTSAKKLYSLAKENNCDLFVDWIFTFNSQVDTIRKVNNSKILGNLKHVFLSRQNYGPFRDDVDARYDLASHDLSILFDVFEQDTKKVVWNNYKRDNSQLQNDSALGFFEFESFTAIINASWAYSKKDRKCFFDFERGHVEWDDSTKSLVVTPDQDISKFLNGEEQSPLHKSIQNFLKKKNFNFKKQEKLTLKIIEALNES